MADQEGRSAQAFLARTTGARHMRRCTGTVGTRIAKCSMSMTMRRGKDNGIARPRKKHLHPMSGLSQEPWNNAPRAAHIRSIVLAKQIQHHVLFAEHPTCKEKPDGQEASGISQPIRKQHCLRERKEQKGTVHWVSYISVDTRLDQGVGCAHFKRHRPIPAEIDVAPVKKPERSAVEDQPKPPERRNKRSIKRLRVPRSNNKHRDRE